MKIIKITVKKVIILLHLAKSLIILILSFRNLVGDIFQQSGSSKIKKLSSMEHWRFKEVNSLIQSQLLIKWKSSMKSENMRMMKNGFKSSQVYKNCINKIFMLNFANHYLCLIISHIMGFMANIIALCSKFWDLIYLI